MENLREMSVKELKEIAKKLKVANWWTLNKATLIEKIEEKENEEKLLDFYDKNWRNYTERYNPVEFIEKVKSGKIKLEDEEPEAEEDQQPEPEEVKEDEETPATTLTPKRGALIEYDGRSQNICAWGEELGISPNTLYGRLYKMGWTVERAFTTPSKKK